MYIYIYMYIHIPYRYMITSKSLLGTIAGCRVALFAQDSKAESLAIPGTWVDGIRERWK